MLIAGACGTMKTILVVEDNEDIREYVTLMLRGDGYEVLEAENGQDALEQLERMPTLPCLLILDLMMPVMSGPELLQTLRQRAGFSQLPVVVLSAGGRQDQVQDVRKFLRKPVDPQRVRSAVREICGTP